jgi:hypothetical protein
VADPTPALNLDHPVHCTVPPNGWWCSREAGHDGPCAARPVAADLRTAPIDHLDGLAAVLADVAAERARQDTRWGQQDHPHGTGDIAMRMQALSYREGCKRHFADGIGTWRDILLEEVYEAMAEADPRALRAELVQVAAVATQWIEAIDREAHRG